MSRQKERIDILIDGGNFHHLVIKKLRIQESEFAFDDFVAFLANGRKVVKQGKRFYVGTVREVEGDIKSKEAMAKQTRLFTALKSSGWEIKTSKLRTRIEKIRIDEKVVGHEQILKKGIKEITIKRKREKGIDVKIATDLIAGAVDDKYDTAIVVSSDTDLIPALDWIKHRQNKKVEYIGFSIEATKTGGEDSRPSQGMITHSDIQRILVLSDLQPFVKSQRRLIDDKK